jgi:hypothetical protein
MANTTIKNEVEKSEVSAENNGSGQQSKQPTSGLISEDL